MHGPDTYLTLLLSLPDAPLKINVAVVRWGPPSVFGVKFQYVEATIHERFAQYLSTLNLHVDSSHIIVIHRPETRRTLTSVSRH